MSIAQMINYYPKYEYLDNAMSRTGHKKLRLFIDVKGCMQSMYQEWAILHVVNQSTGTQQVDHSLFASMLEYIRFHKQWARTRNIELEMILFLEYGPSTYHKKVYSEYKANRGGDDMFFNLTSDQRELFRDVLNKNLTVISNVVPRLPGVECIRLEFLEADFIPYYVRNFCAPKEDTTDIIYSTDKDMLQCLQDDNILQFYRSPHKVEMLTRDTLWKHYLKTTQYPKEVSPDYFPLALSIIGDDADNFKGVHGIANKTFIKFMIHLDDIFGTIQEVNDNIEAGRSIFKEGVDTSIPKVTVLKKNEKLIVRNMKLASYELLSRYVNADYPSERVKMKNFIKSSCSFENKLQNGKILHAALHKAGLMQVVNEATIYNIFQE